MNRTFRNAALASALLLAPMAAQAADFLSIGSCLSALTRNQVVAFILAVVVCFVFLLSGLPMVMDLVSGWAPRRASPPLQWRCQLWQRITAQNG